MLARLSVTSVVAALALIAGTPGLTIATAVAQSSAAPAAGARAVNEKNDLYEFEYSYPANVARIPRLKAMLDNELDGARTRIKSQATEARKMSRESDFPFHPYSYSLEWKVVTDLPGWLSLSALVGLYTGGAHPNYAFGTVLWDKAASRRRVPTDLFVSKAAFARAINTSFCKELDRQRAKKRGDQPASSIPEFGQCIDPAAQTVILGSSNGKAFDRIGILIPPYEAGPYAEGVYEVTLPVTRQVLATVRPQFRKAFAAK